MCTERRNTRQTEIQKYVQHFAFVQQTMPVHVGPEK